MKLFLSILLFLATAFTTVMAIEFYDLYDLEISIADTSGENKSENNTEKEPTEKGEDDTEIKLFAFQVSPFEQSLSSAHLLENLTIRGGHIIELSDPPPELT